MRKNCSIQAASPVIHEAARAAMPTTKQADDAARGALAQPMGDRAHHAQGFPRWANLAATLANDKSASSYDATSDKNALAAAFDTPA